MKKLLVLATALMLSSASFAGVTDVYNAINSNPDENATKVDQKASALKSKVDSKLSNLQNKLADKSSSATAKQENLKAQLEEKLANLVKSGNGDSSKANELKAEIESLQKLIEAARK